MNKSLEEIKALVIDRIEEYLLHLLPGGEFYKSKFYIGAVVLKVNRKILKINFYLVDYKAKDAFNTFYVI